MNKKPRTQRLQYEFKDPVTFNGPEDIIFQDGHFKLKDINGNIVSPHKARITNFYKRNNNKNKTLNVLDFQGNEFIDANTALLKKHNAVFAIDTNTSVNNNLDNGDTISITSVIRIVLDQETGTLLLIPIRFYEFRNSEAKIENVAWCILIQEILSDLKASNTSANIGLIVDSDLGNLNNFQSRKEPIIDGFFLPEEISLIYAGADSGKEFWANKAIGVSDKWAKTIEQKIRSVNEEHFHLFGSRYFSHFRSHHVLFQATDKNTKEELHNYVDNLFTEILSANDYSLGFKALYVPDQPSCKIEAMQINNT